MAVAGTPWRAPPAGEGVQPAVGRRVGTLPGRADQRRRRGEAAEPVQRLIRRGLVQVPGAVHLRRPVTFDQLVGDVGPASRRRRPPQRAEPRATAVRWRSPRRPTGAAVCGSAMSPRLHHDVGAVGHADRSIVFCAWAFGCRTRCQHDPAAAGRGHLRGQEQPEAAHAAGDDVGAVGAEHRGLARRHHHADRARCAARPARACRCARRAPITRIAVGGLGESGECVFAGTGSAPSPTSS